MFSLAEFYMKQPGYVYAVCIVCVLFRPLVAYLFFVCPCNCCCGGTSSFPTRLPNFPGISRCSSHFSPSFATLAPLFSLSQLHWWCYLFLLLLYGAPVYNIPPQNINILIVSALVPPPLSIVSRVWRPICFSPLPVGNIFYMIQPCQLPVAGSRYPGSTQLMQYDIPHIVVAK